MRRTPYHSSYDEQERRLTIAGDVEGAAAYRFEASLHQLHAAGGGVVDLSGVTYLPSAATGPLVVAVRDALRAGVELRLVAAPQGIASVVLTTMGVEHGPA